MSAALIEWGRPFALVALLVPLAVWWLARSSGATRMLATGTLDVWRKVAEQDPNSGRKRRARSTPGLRFAIAALVLGAFALAAPRIVSARASRTWRITIDRRPAMYLSDRGSTRIERAISSARSWLARELAAGDDVVWIAASRDALDEARADAPPAEWLRAPRVLQRAPDWLVLDAPGAIWLTDREPEATPRQAVLVLSGGVAAPGPIDARGSTRFDWDGELIVEVQHGAAERRVTIDPDVAPPLARVAIAWAGARGFRVDAKSGHTRANDTRENDVRAGDSRASDARVDAARAGAEVALAIRARSAGRPESIVAGRDGWQAHGDMGNSAPAVDEDGALDTWLDAGFGATRRALITIGPGRVCSAWSRMDEPTGDPAAFAVSLAALFDDCALAPVGVVALRDRLDAGAGEVRVPAASHDARSSGATIRIDAWLALGALLAALAAVVLASGAEPARTVAPSRAIG